MLLNLTQESERTHIIPVYSCFVVVFHGSQRGGLDLFKMRAHASLDALAVLAHF